MDCKIGLRELARRYTAAWCSQDAASVFMTAFPDLQVFMDDLVEQRGKVIYRWTLEGTNRAPGGTGNRIEHGVDRP